MWHVRTYVKGITITQTSLNYEANLIILPEITTQKKHTTYSFFCQSLLKINTMQGKAKICMYMYE